MTYESNYISHHGVKGQKWGVRRYQNKNGSLTPAGKRRYGSYYVVNSDGDLVPASSVAKESVKKGNTSKKSVVSKIKEKYQSLPSGVQKAINIGSTMAGIYMGFQILDSPKVESFINKLIEKSNEIHGNRTDVEIQVIPERQETEQEYYKRIGEEIKRRFEEDKGSSI